MPPITNKTNGKPYLRIVGGSFVRKVANDYVANPDDFFRVREAKNLSTGEEIKVPELVYPNWQGLIERIEIVNKNFGTDDKPKNVRQLEIEMDDCVITIPTATKYFTSVAQSILLADLKQNILLHPYSMDTPKGKKNGVSVQQNGVKLSSYFYNFETKEYIEGYPAVNEEMKDKTGYWKMYYAEVEDYICEVLTKHFTEHSPVVPDFGEDIEEADINDLPWE